MSEDNIPFKQDNQEYAIITQLYGSSRLKVKIIDSDRELICNIPGKFRRRVWVKKDDIILVSVRAFQDSHCDMIYRYSPDEVKKLQAYGEIGSNGSDDKEDEIIFFTEDDQKEIDLEDL